MPLYLCPWWRHKPKPVRQWITLCDSCFETLQLWRRRSESHLILQLTAVARSTLEEEVVASGLTPNGQRACFTSPCDIGIHTNPPKSIHLITTESTSLQTRSQLSHPYFPAQPPFSPQPTNSSPSSPAQVETLPALPTHWSWSGIELDESTVR